jgi:putative phosphoribosyl transferase
LVAALPVSAANTSRQLESLVDELVVIEDTDDFSSVSEWYLEFAQVSNEEVLNLLPKPEGQMYT